MTAHRKVVAGRRGAKRAPRRANQTPLPMPPSLFEATREPEVVEIPARRVLAIDGDATPGGPEFEASMQALYGVAYTLKFARKAAGGADFRIGPVEGYWRLGPTGFLWRLRLSMPDDVSKAELGEAIAQATSKKGGKLFGSAAAHRLYIERIPRQRVGRVLHVGTYASEPETFARLRASLAKQDLQLDPSSGHLEVYLSDPRRTAPEKIRTVLLREVCRVDGRRAAD